MNVFSLSEQVVPTLTTTIKNEAADHTNNNNNNACKISRIFE